MLQSCHGVMRGDLLLLATAYAEQVGVMVLGNALLVLRLRCIYYNGTWEYLSA